MQQVLIARWGNQAQNAQKLPSPVDESNSFQESEFFKSVQHNEKYMVSYPGRLIQLEIYRVPNRQRFCVHDIFQ
jgi:hypothetical protein